MDANLQTVQDLPLGTHQREASTTSFGLLLPDGPLLPAFGSRRREWKLWQWYLNDRNWLFSSAVAALGKKIASTPYKIIGDNPKYTLEQARTIFDNANFGRGWRDFVFGWVQQYCIHSIMGAVVEIIGPGDPRGPIWGLPTGISLLDPFYCFPTGNPIWPVIYWEAPRNRKRGAHKDGAYRWLHHDRVYYTVDQPYYRRHYPAVGRSALERAISIVYEQIYTSTYVSQALDDKPQPAIYHLHNINPESWERAWDGYQSRLDNDWMDARGRTLSVKSLQTDAESKIELLQFSNPPTAFNYREYTDLQARAIATALGIDIQDIWEITQSGNLGTSTQSEILARKGAGQTEADIYAALERFSLQLLPDGYNLEFEFKDQESDQMQAQIASQYQNSVTQAVVGGIVTADQARRYLTMVDDTWQRVFENTEIDVVTDRDPIDEGEAAVFTRAWSNTRTEFVRMLTNVFQQNYTGRRGGRRLSNNIRALLRRFGRQAYRDGFAEAGAPIEELSTRDRMRLQSWMSDEGKFVTNLIQGSQELRRGLEPGPAAAKAELWANKSLRKIYNIALKNADENLPLQWVLDPLKENCTTCLQLNGQIHSTRQWKESGWEPGVRWLECGGWECGCRFVPRPGASATGNLSGVRKIIRETDAIKSFGEALAGSSCGGCA